MTSRHTIAEIRRALFLLLFAVFWAGTAMARGDSAQAPCAFSDSAFDPASDIHALTKYQDAIAQMLKREKFAQLDCLARAARNGKTRFSGGAWMLRNFYIGLESPRPGHPTQEDWRRHLILVRRWRDRNPGNITARIALAESYVMYGWDARGEGFSDSVSDSGWKLFEQRVETARKILVAASSWKIKCPDWFIAMQEVAQGQSWDGERTAELFRQAAAFEPEYQYYYRFYATSLLPKWGGEQGSAARFAEQAANRVGGEDGDLLYFLIASKVVCACQEPEFTHFSWPRLQKGFAATEKKYGMDLLNVNNIAMMAVKASDWVVADPAFKRIGDNWSKDVWLTEDWFRQNRAVAASTAAAQLRSRAIQQEAEANLQSPEWNAYRQGFEEKFADLKQPCAEKAKQEPTAFDFLINVGKDGDVDDAWGTHPTPLMQCLMKSLYDTHVKNEKPFPAPPKAPYWIVVHMDPSPATAAVQ